MARAGTPPPHGFSNAMRGSNRVAANPASASRRAHCAPAGPPPMIATLRGTALPAPDAFMDSSPDASLRPDAPADPTLPVPRGLR